MALKFRKLTEKDIYHKMLTDFCKIQNCDPHNVHSNIKAIMRVNSKMIYQNFKLIQQLIEQE